MILFFVFPGYSGLHNKSLPAYKQLAMLPSPDTDGKPATISGKGDDQKDEYEQFDVRRLLSLQGQRGRTIVQPQVQECTQRTLLTKWESSYWRDTCTGDD